MLVLDRDGRVLSYNNEELPPRPNRGFAEVAAQPENDLSGRIRRLVELAFDQLGLRSLELRVRDDDSDGGFSAGLLWDDLERDAEQFELEYGLDRS